MRRSDAGVHITQQLAISSNVCKSTSAQVVTSQRGGTLWVPSTYWSWRPGHSGEDPPEETTSQKFPVSGSGLAGF